MTSDSIAEREMQKVYWLNGILHLPHYQSSKRNIYVSPAYGQTHWTEYTEMDLICLGAKRGDEYLLVRRREEG